MHRTAWLAVAAANGFIAVIASVLGGFMTPDPGGADSGRLLTAGASFEMTHALAIMALCAFGWSRDSVAWLFFYAILLFSGSVYLRVLGAPQPTLALAVLGVLLALIGWALLGWWALTHPRA